MMRRIPFPSGDFRPAANRAAGPSSCASAAPVGATVVSPAGLAPAAIKRVRRPDGVVRVDTPGEGTLFRRHVVYGSTSFAARSGRS